MKDAAYYAGADVGGTGIKLGLYEKGKEGGRLAAKWEIPTDRSNDGGNIISDIAVSLKDVCEKNGICREDVAGVGIGVPGPVGAGGIVTECVNLGWKFVDAGAMFRKISGIPAVMVENDANVSALGEMWKGGGRGFRNLVMVTLGTGVGGGIIIDGKIHSGSTGAAGEIGHIKVNPNETEECNCKSRGCLEQYSSATGIVRLAKKTGGFLDNEKLDAKMVVDMAKAGNGPAEKAVDKAMEYLGMALANVACVTDPQVFVIGGGVSAAGDFLLEKIKKYYNIYSMDALRGKEFKIAALGNDAGFYGCIKMVMDNA